MSDRGKISRWRVSDAAFTRRAFPRFFYHLPPVSFPLLQKHIQDSWPSLGQGREVWDFVDRPAVSRAVTTDFARNP